MHKEWVHLLPRTDETCQYMLKEWVHFFSSGPDETWIRYEFIHTHHK
jgi:hypothetical protein